MTVPSAPSVRHPVEQLAEDFVTRFRQGERPSLSEYVQQFPEVSEELADIIGTLLALEDLRTFGQQVESSPPIPERLGEFRSWGKSVGAEWEWCLRRNRRNSADWWR
jgi:mannitol-1-phosphate/altronate dehydrogenase